MEWNTESLKPKCSASATLNNQNLRSQPGIPMASAKCDAQLHYAQSQPLFQCCTYTMHFRRRPHDAQQSDRTTACNVCTFACASSLAGAELRVHATLVQFREIKAYEHGDQHTICLHSVCVRVWHVVRVALCAFVCGCNQTNMHAEEKKKRNQNISDDVVGPPSIA